MLALDDNHPYWKAEPAAFPAVKPVQIFDDAKMILMHRHHNALLLPDGVTGRYPKLGHVEEKYTKFAYSSKFGFSVRKANNCLENMAPDSELVFEVGGFFFGRGTVSEANIAGNGIVSRWFPFEGIDVVTELVVDAVSGSSYSLKHTITSKIECTAYSCGFAIPLDWPGYCAEAADDCAVITTSRYGCEVTGGPGLIINASPNTNLLYPCTAIPAVKHTIDVGTNEVRTSVIMYP